MKYCIWQFFPIPFSAKCVFVCQLIYAPFRVWLAQVLLDAPKKAMRTFNQTKPD